MLVNFRARGLISCHCPQFCIRNPKKLASRQSTDPLRPISRQEVYAENDS